MDQDESELREVCVPHSLVCRLCDCSIYNATELEQEGKINEHKGWNTPGFDAKVQINDVTELRGVSYNMESEQQLASPSSDPCSLTMMSSSASTTPAPTQRPSTKCNPTSSSTGSSPLTSCDHLLRSMTDEHLHNLDSSNGFPLVNNPTFGFHTSDSSHSDFGGLGNLGFSSLSAHSHFGTIPDWWQPLGASTRAAFFPPLLGLHPVFASSFKSHDPVHLQSITSGVNRTVNGRSASSPGQNLPVNSSLFPAKGNQGKAKARSRWNQNNGQDLGQMTTKLKKPNKPPIETSSMSGSQSGSLSGSSSDCDESSGDPDDIEEGDSDEDGNDQSNESDESDSDKDDQVKHKVERLTQNTSESKKKRPSTAVDSHCDSVPLTSSYCFQSSSFRLGTFSLQDYFSGTAGPQRRRPSSTSVSSRPQGY
ncbi:hypothetical protein Q5P01_013476 [Channa striata]|uniref:Uncharacterized protein n=1 Tax=Channa striata TaxID=64152 RepID=A0AA88MKK6_CHASR|nr:hypothetical protein Q5P01_013476 [Channa striata]